MEVKINKIMKLLSLGGCSINLSDNDFDGSLYDIDLHSFEDTASC